ncbi:MAG TPA: ShlB/FhaC/HecB family hemolysin secretion/activation protein, partial [Methylophaga sp.]|nr:ShlB/FhaC/HecB family hemolysin secretion/activation protein [Methylophaga sp.]
MSTAQLLCRQFFMLPVITISLGLTTAVLAEEGLGAAAARDQLNSRYQQQEKRRRDLLQKQQQQDSTVRLQPELAETPLTDDDALEQPCFVVERIELTGKQAEKFEFALQNLLNQQPSPIGRCLGVKGVNSIIRQLQNRIIKAGYVTTRVLIEPQDISTGALVLSVIPGIVNRIKLTNNSSSNRMLVTSVPIKQGELLNIRDIEQAVENLRRIPTATVEVDIVPSEGKNIIPGYSDLLIHHRQSKPFRLTLGVDDSGYDATGRYQGTATLSLDNPLNLSDLLYLSFSRDLGDAENDGGTDGHALHYSLPLGY